MEKRHFFRLLLALIVAVMMLPMTSAAQEEGNHFLKIEAAEMVSVTWENQFWIVFGGEDGFDGGEPCELTMKVRADKPATVHAQLHSAPGEYLAWNFIDGGNTEVNFTTDWTPITIKGNFLAPTSADWFQDNINKKIKSIAFGFNDNLPEANTYYFDDISLKIDGVEVIKNGDCEGDDFSSFVYKYDNGAMQDVERPYTDLVCNATALDLSGISTEIDQGAQLRGRIIVTLEDGTTDYVPIHKAATTLDNTKVGEQVITVTYLNALEQMTVNVIGDYGNESNFLTIKASAGVDAWDNQFWIVFGGEKGFEGGEYCELTMKIRADKAASASAQLHSDPGTYLQWYLFEGDDKEGGNKVPFTTKWTTFKISGNFLSKDDWVDPKASIKSIAFNLNEFKEANTYYFDDISLIIGGEEVIKNGDCEGKDFSNFWYKYNKGAALVVKPIASCDIAITPDAPTYNGSAITPTIVISDGETTLVENTDYTVTLPDDAFKNAKDYHITIEGIGDYSGTVTKKFTINPLKTTYGALTIAEYGDQTTATINGKYDGTDAMTLPQGGIQVDQVTVNRNFAEGEGVVYSTMVLPFDAIFPDGVGKFYTFHGVEYDEDDSKWIACVYDASSAPANTPFIFDPSGTVSQLSWNASSTKINLTTDKAPTTTVTDETYGGEWTFTGTYQRQRLGDLPTDKATYYGFAGANNKGIAIGEFVRGGDNAFVRPFRCYLAYNDPNGLSKTATVLPDRIEVRVIGSTTEPTDPQDDPNSGDIETPTSELTPARTSSANVWSYAKTIYIAAAPNAPYTIVDINGRPLQNGITATDRDEIHLSGKADGIVIVNIGGKSFKIRY